MILGSVLHGILAFFFAVIALLLIIVILLQRGKGVGLAGAFGGTGGHTAFGTKTGDFLTWVTVVGAGVLLLFAVLLNFVFQPAPPSLEPESPPPAQAPPSGGGTPPADGSPTPWTDGPDAWSVADPGCGWSAPALRPFGQDEV